MPCFTMNKVRPKAVSRPSSGFEVRGLVLPKKPFQFGVAILHNFSFSLSLSLSPSRSLSRILSACASSSLALFATILRATRSHNILFCHGARKCLAANCRAGLCTSGTDTTCCRVRPQMSTRELRPAQVLTRSKSRNTTH
mmetsp:Transcript_47392/g.93220  ORF Transcript_47392/g.93220 Transcript_47392/m.93220 type:complete len:140 (-) Transcript_47392:195-614(-)